ncbi:MAG: ATP-binding protein, partial [Melioribacteraceae bacterium]|nr:ATP-binding protein [Melioribacteraceae bacterium]
LPLRVFGGKQIVNFTLIKRMEFNFLDSLSVIYKLNNESKFGYIFEQKSKNYYLLKSMENFTLVLKLNGLTLFEKSIDQIYFPSNIQFAIANEDEMVEYSTNKFWIKQKINKYFDFDKLENNGQLEDNSNMVCNKWESKYLGTWLIITNEISSDYNKFYNIVYKLLFYSILIYLLIAVFTLIYSRQISKNINKMTKVASAVGEGNFDNKINIKRDDELGLLINTFNQMVDNLKQSYSQLSVTNKQLESKIDELVKTKSELTKQQKLALIGETISKISHEMQNKISGVSVWVQNLEMQSSLSENNLIYVEEIKKSLNSFVEMLLNFKKFYRKPYLEKSSFDFLKLIEHIINQFHSDIYAKELNIEVKTKLKKLEIFADRSLLEELFVNILVNAIYFSPQSSKIIIDIIVNENEMQISVVDEGKGIDEDIIENIFHPFFTTKSSGSGLGLAISKNIVDAHNGEIEVSRKVKVGAKIIVKLPLK